MTPQLARLKRRVRAGIGHIGGIDGAAATAERSRSTVGDWNNLNHPAFPPADCALAIDEACIAVGRDPEVLFGMAAELGFVVLRLPDPGQGLDLLSAALIEASAEFGDIAAEVRDATRDGHLDARERERIVKACDEAMQALGRVRAIVADNPSTAKRS